MEHGSRLSEDEKRISQGKREHVRLFSGSHSKSSDDTNILQGSIPASQSISHARQKVWVPLEFVREAFEPAVDEVTARKPSKSALEGLKSLETIVGSCM